MLMMEMMIDRIKPGKSAQCTDVETLHEEFSQAMNDNDENLETRDEEKSVLRSPSPGEGGRDLQDAHHWQLHRALGQAAPGEGQHHQL